MPQPSPRMVVESLPVDAAPRHLDLQRTKGLEIEWQDGSRSFYPVAYLRRMSPSIDSRQLREDLESNPLAVLPPAAQDSKDLHAVDAELVGNYAVRIRFSDGHASGIYSWDYLRQIDPRGESS